MVPPFVSKHGWTTILFNSNSTLILGHKMQRGIGRRVSGQNDQGDDMVLSLRFWPSARLRNAAGMFA